MSDRNPASTGLPAEDRARLNDPRFRQWLEREALPDDYAAFTRALALIDHQAKALEAADELADLVLPLAPARIAEAARAYRSTRTERTTDG